MRPVSCKATRSVGGWFAAIVMTAAMFGCAEGSSTGTGGNALATDVDPLQAGQGGKKDAGAEDVPPADVAAANNGVGAPCQGDVQCESGICSGGACAKACQTVTDCTGAELCGSDGKRLLCHTPKFSKAVGQSCAGVGQCPDGLKCIGNPDAASAVCSAECGTDLDCPATMACRTHGDGSTYCRTRNFCDECLSDAQCGPGGLCVKMDGGAFCSHACTPGKTECPRFSDCKDVGGGQNACVHRAGTCQGKGEVCDPCSTWTDNCQAGACLTFTFTKEQFCTEKCDSAGKCRTGYKCVEIQFADGKQKHCVPADEKAPKCVNKLTPMMEVGDIMEDFAMVSYVDEDGDGNLAKRADGTYEDPHVVHLKEFIGPDSQYDVILFNLAAGWCGPCQAETKTFKAMLKAYPNIQVFQVLFDGAKAPSVPTLQFLKQWVAVTNAAGITGIDPERNAVPYNTGGSTPLNIVIDAKTGKILKKVNGAPATGVLSLLKPYLPK